ncbi:MAG: FxsA family protein [Pseudomonadales bacterium]|nr:FxsA family protein [Pseudomonadales bacterium]
MRVFFWLLLAAPLIELWFIIRVGSALGGLTTIVLLLAAGITGMNLLRLQGFNTLSKLDQRLQQGESPATEILESFALALAAFLLIIPGFITDFLAIPLLIPPLRRWLVHRFIGTHYYSQHYSQHYRQQTYRDQGDIIDGEYRREDDPRLR